MVKDIFLLFEKSIFSELLLKSKKFFQNNFIEVILAYQVSDLFFDLEDCVFQDAPISLVLFFQGQSELA